MNSRSHLMRCARNACWACGTRAEPGGIRGVAATGIVKCFHENREFSFEDGSTGTKSLDGFSPCFLSEL